MIKPKDGDKKVDKHDGRGEDVDEEHDKCEPRPLGAATDTQITEVHGSVATASVHVA